MEYTILLQLCKLFGVNISVMASKTRLREIVELRTIYTALCRERLLKKVKRIETHHVYSIMKHLHKDRSSYYHYILVFNDLMDTNSVFRNKYNLARNTINSDYTNAFEDVGREIFSIYSMETQNSFIVDKKNVGSLVRRLVLDSFKNLEHEKNLVNTD